MMDLRHWKPRTTAWQRWASYFQDAAAGWAADLRSPDDAPPPPAVLGEGAGGRGRVTGEIAGQAGGQDRGPGRAVGKVTGPPMVRSGTPARNGARTRRPAPSHPHPAFTPDALHRAWRKVRAAGGGAGADGETLEAFAQQLDHRLAELGAELSGGAHRPRGPRTVFVPKPDGGLRPLVVWALRDRVAQRAVHDHLDPRLDPGFLDCSHGFRPGRSVGTAVKAVLAGRDEGRPWVLDADIKRCFEHIDPDRLLALLRPAVPDRRILRLVELWLQAEVLDARGRGRPAGAAQGGVLSPLLCNVYLQPFDRDLTARGIRLVRYADDLVCLERRRQDAQAAWEVAAASLARLGMTLHPQKTRLTSFQEGFGFLGYCFLGQRHFPLAPQAKEGGR